MKNLNVTVLGIFSILTIGCSSSDDDSGSQVPPPPTASIEVKLDGIEKLEGDLTYEGWLIVEGEDPVSTGRFNTIESEFKMEFTALKSVIDDAKSFAISIEPTKNDEPEPSDTKILFGDFSADTAELTIDDVVVGAFDDTDNPFSGSFINITPTDNTGGVDNNNDENGVWFIKDFTTPGLINLPTLGKGWKYEGWVVFDEETPVSTGKFTKADGVDEVNPHSRNDEPAPKFPGEDFIAGLPKGADGITIDGDTTGKRVVISIEPSIEGDPDAPFYLKPIAGTQGVNDNALNFVSNINGKIEGRVVKL